MSWVMAMARNAVQSQKGLSEPEFERCYGARGSVQAVDNPLIGRTLHPGPAAGAHTDYVLRTLLGLGE
jgi:hypothetical protein